MAISWPCHQGYPCVLDGVCGLWSFVVDRDTVVVTFGYGETEQDYDAVVSSGCVGVCLGWRCVYEDTKHGGLLIDIDIEYMIIVLDFIHTTLILERLSLFSKSLNERVGVSVDRKIVVIS
jgi:hypothetical protein